MGLRYYLRGLGIGIAVTAAVMSVSANRRSTELTDEQIRVRARALGMVDGVLTTLPEAEESAQGGETDVMQMESESGQASAETPEAEEVADSAETPEAEEVADSAETPDTKEDADSAETPEAGENADREGTPEAGGNAGRAETPDPKGNTVTQETLAAGTSKPKEAEPVVETHSAVTVAVYPGEGSYTISRKLASLGLVESADIFDDFLCQNGYDKKLATGNYTIYAGATAHDIARILTGG